MVNKDLLLEKIAFHDLSLDSNDRKELLDAIDAVLKHGHLILGPEVERFEHEVASYCQREYAVGVSSGTDALYLGLRACDIGQGDEVIVPALSWIATANAVAMTGAKPVFADICDDLNMDPESTESLISSRTKAILCVHYAGKLCDIEKFKSLSKKYDIHFIEDASQAFGARRNGYQSGGEGLFAAFSLNPMKVLGACGEAGVLVMDDKTIYQRVLQLRYNGMPDKERCVEPGLNGRIDTLQAAILLKRLKYVEEKSKYRTMLALRYDAGLCDLVKTPQLDLHERHAYYTYIIQVEERNALCQYLNENGIEAKIRDPFLMSDQPAYYDQTQGQYSRANTLVSNSLSLPLHEKLREAQVDYVVSAIREFLLKNRAVTLNRTSAFLNE